MSDGQTDRENRMALADRWRQLGEKLRRRSPQSFAKMIEMLAASAVSEDEDDEQNIDEVYRIH